jgi:hypothetical protein
MPAVCEKGTGCIYKYDDAHALGSGKGFTEKDAPNFAGSFYSRTKGHVQSVRLEHRACRPVRSRSLAQLLEFYSNVLTLRVRMPISDDLRCVMFPRGETGF